jgi:hypothetical protein
MRRNGEHHEKILHVVCVLNLYKSLIFIFAKAWAYLYSDMFKWHNTVQNGL